MPLERKYVGRLVPSNPKVLIMSIVGVAVANEAVSFERSNALYEIRKVGTLTFITDPWL